jgi:hypothetical protein
MSRIRVRVPSFGLNARVGNLLVFSSVHIRSGVFTRQAVRYAVKSIYGERARGRRLSLSIVP